MLGNIAHGLGPRRFRDNPTAGMMLASHSPVKQIPTLILSFPLRHPFRTSRPQTSSNSSSHSPKFHHRRVYPHPQTFPTRQIDLLIWSRDSASCGHRGLSRLWGNGRLGRLLHRDMTSLVFAVLSSRIPLQVNPRCDIFAGLF